ncbi:replicative DNA helicase [Sunxiuqinia sp. A32]|uniref:replicative DNA helicase n=1 Tax=Sunxiuqinia sp. A32 TaxID=3461496 RepID=UPI00404629B9
MHELNQIYGKLPPQAVDVEEAVLGALMLERDAFELVNGIICEESFYKDEHRIIYHSIKLLTNENSPIDLLMVTQKLKDLGELDAVGGPLYITKLTGRVASASHIEFHARIIAQKFMQRELIRLSTDANSKAYDDTIDVDDLISEIKHKIDQIENLSSIDTGSLQDKVLIETIKEIENDCALQQKGHSPGISTGFRTLDDFIGGWRSANLIILAARPGIGKTSLALFSAKIAALNSKWVNFFSFEMKKTDLQKAMISGESGVSRTKIRDGYLNNDDWTKINSSIGQIEKLPIIWNDRAGMTVNQVKGIIRKNRKAGRCDLVVIDYLQLIAPTDKKAIREQQVSEISRVLKEISLNENIPVICLSQLNREADDVEPKPSHLRESGAIEQDADVILFPWRPGYNGKKMTSGELIPESEIKLIVGKNRRGRRGSFMIYCNDEMTQFSEEKYEITQTETGYDPDQRIEASNEPF